MVDLSRLIVVTRKAAVGATSPFERVPAKDSCPPPLPDIQGGNALTFQKEALSDFQRRPRGSF